MPTVRSLVAVLLLLATPPAAAEAPAWIAKSDANARLVLEASARFSPEGAGRLGLEGFDEQVLDLKPGILARTRATQSEVLAALRARAEQETDDAVRQDLGILIRSLQDRIESDALEERLSVAYFDVPQTIFQGLRALLDDQLPAARRARALVRLRKYAGLQPPETTPLTQLARDRVRESLQEPGRIGPYRDEVLRHVENSGSYVKGIAELFQKHGLDGWQPAHAALAKQVEDWNAFLRAEVLPRSRTDYRLPKELYATSLRQFGVDVDPDHLAARARVAFAEIRNEMASLAPLVAREKGLPSSDYREVIRALKRDQVRGEAILPLYERRMKDLEEIIRRERLLTLPARPARIRLASEAESAAVPAPNMRPPRLIGNTGEQGTFVLPLRVPTAGAAGTKVQEFDDFSFEAASWTLTAHEGRPGHELQFAAVVEKGVSIARAVFAFNSANVEGWGLYAEAEAKPYEPLEGQLIALQHRLLRAARAFLDPDLQANRISPEAATAFLMSEVVLSEPMARQEVERYTFRAPGQATSYFYGYTRWMQLRAETELALGARFDRLRYHDFVLAQGLLPPDLMSEAVRTRFVPAERAR
jgi:hypothetical protein